CALVPVKVVFPGEFCEQAEFAADVPVAFQVELVLAVLAADDPGLGFNAAQQAERVALMQQAEVGTGGEIVAPADIVVDFQIGRSQGKGLCLRAEPPAAASPAFKIGGQYPVCAGVGASAAEADLPGGRGEERIARAQGPNFHAGDLLYLQFMVVVVEPGVQPEELELGAGTIACRGVNNVMVGRAEGQLSELLVSQLPGAQAQTEGVVALVIPYLRLWYGRDWGGVVNSAAGHQ